MLLSLPLSQYYEWGAALPERQEPLSSLWVAFVADDDMTEQRANRFFLIARVFYYAARGWKQEAIANKLHVNKVRVWRILKFVRRA